jgi:hypothetical protein
MVERRFRIHPAIGVARVGNAKRGRLEGEGWFIGPEIPGIPPNWNAATGRFEAFKQADGVKAQAARFRVYEYVRRNDDGKWMPSREISLDTPGIRAIRWRVHLANRKASFFNFDGQSGASDTFAGHVDPDKHWRNPGIETLGDRAARLEIDPGEKSIEGRSADPVDLANPSAPRIPIATLGELRTDARGRLVVTGGYGASGIDPTLPVGPRQGATGDLIDYANNHGWFDDVSDGPVSAEVELDGEALSVAADGAWLLVGPPDFAPALDAVVTLYDALWDVAVRKLPLPADSALFEEYAPGRGLARLAEMQARWQVSASLVGFKPSFTEDVWPTLARGYGVRWVHQPLGQPAGGATPHRRIAPPAWATLASLPGNQGLRNSIVNRTRGPDAQGTDNPSLMPKAQGDDPYTSNWTSHLTLTHIQHAILRQWRDGAFTADWPGQPPPRPQPVDDIAPERLDRAALEGCVGGAFYPGIEASWLVRDPRVFSEPFRVRRDANLGETPLGPLTVRAGFFSQQMALPWQADFMDCKKEEGGNAADGFFAWWPAQRPDDVFVDGGGAAMVPWTRGFAVNGAQRYKDMIGGWHTRGFVVEDGEGMVEREGPTSPAA